jgi:hypothetical protein
MMHDDTVTVRLVNLVIFLDLRNSTATITARDAASRNGLPLPLTITAAGLEDLLREALTRQPTQEEQPR